MNKIELHFDKSANSLAGFPYGESVYLQQVKDKIVFNEQITIVFPNQIERIASSFVQGFFSAFVDAIGYSGIEKQVIVEARTNELVENIRKNIY
ncbi:MAG: hypothetical protein J1E98_11600 [Lachnospiraceae bacterium]|nr:hypothetical protein [Lachnospiraceae bacterium]